MKIMMIKIKSIFLITVSSLLLFGCAFFEDHGIGRTTGTIAGAIIGAGGASYGTKNSSTETQVAAIVLGLLGGGALGNWIGKYWDERDHRTAMEIIDTYPTGKTGSWENPDSNSKFSVTPVETLPQQADGQACRRFVVLGNINGVRQENSGKACRQPNGAWKISSGY